VIGDHNKKSVCLWLDGNKANQTQAPSGKATLEHANKEKIFFQ